MDAHKLLTVQGREGLPQDNTRVPMPGSPSHAPRQEPRRPSSLTFRGIDGINFPLEAIVGFAFKGTE